MENHMRGTTTTGYLSSRAYKILVKIVEGQFHYATVKCHPQAPKARTYYTETKEIALEWFRAAKKRNIPIEFK